MHNNHSFWIYLSTIFADYAQQDQRWNMQQIDSPCQLENQPLPIFLDDFIMLHNVQIPFINVQYTRDMNRSLFVIRALKFFTDHNMQTICHVLRFWVSIYWVMKLFTFINLIDDTIREHFSNFIHSKMEKFVAKYFLSKTVWKFAKEKHPSSPFCTRGWLNQHC